MQASSQINKNEQVSVRYMAGCILKAELLRNIGRKSLLWNANLIMENASSKVHFIFRNYVLNFVDLYGFFPL